MATTYTIQVSICDNLMIARSHVESDQIPSSFRVNPRPPRAREGEINPQDVFPNREVMMTFFFFFQMCYFDSNS
jgi:hypothetical protein